MSRALARDIPRSLLSTPQRLGILPTWWFWNDPERQRLLMPLSLATALPLGPLVVLATVKLGLSIWVLYAVLLVIYPTLLMGLVERHIRRQLGRRGGAVNIDVHPDAPRFTVSRVVLACILVNLTALLGIAAGSLLLGAVVGGSALLLWFMLPVIRRMLVRLDQASRHAALREGEKRE